MQRSVRARGASGPRGICTTFIAFSICRPLFHLANPQRLIVIRHDWLDGFSSLRDDLRLLASAAEAKQAKTPLVQTRPFRFGTGSWNSFCKSARSLLSSGLCCPKIPATIVRTVQYETVPLHADGDANFPFFYSQSAFGSFAQ